MTESLSQQQQLDELARRPDIDEISRRYRELMASVRDRLTAELGLGPWVEDDDTTGFGYGCREYPAVDIGLKGYDFPAGWVLRAPIPEDKWPRAVAIFESVAAGYGFEAKARVVVDRPGDHEVTVADAYGGDVFFGTQAATVLSARTGCHLTSAAHPRPGPSSPPTS